MKRSAGICIVICLVVSCAYAMDSGTVPAAQQPVVKEFNGAKANEAISLEAGVYPQFNPIEVDPVTDAGCQTATGSVFGYLVDKGITTVSPSTGKAVDADTAKLGRLPTDLSMKLLDIIDIRPYAQTAKILVTWTIRIEGNCPVWGIGHVICEPWVGTFSSHCRAGDVETFLKGTYKVGAREVKFVKGPVSMQMPSGDTGPVTQLDPTVTGTFVLMPKDFPENDNKIPEDLVLEVLWENKSPLRVYSPAGMRKIIVNVLPYTKTSNE